jgi:hypothetical protein
MFEQSPTLGPGTGTVTQHTAEIFLLLAGAFLLGMLLHWLISRSLSQRLRRQSIEMQRLKERLANAERRPVAMPRLRESNSTEHERTLNQLRESRDAEARGRERIIELEGRLALAEHAAEAAAPAKPAAEEDKKEDLLDSVLPFVSPGASKPGRS